MTVRVFQSTPTISCTQRAEVGLTDTPRTQKLSRTREELGLENSVLVTQSPFSILMEGEARPK